MPKITRKIHISNMEYMYYHRTQGSWILDLVEVEMVAARHGAVLLRLREAGPLGEEGVGAARVSLPHAANAGKYFMRH